MSDVSDSTMGIGLSGESVKRILFTLLTVQADILFAEEAVRLSVEEVLTFFSNDRPRDDLWVRMRPILSCGFVRVTVHVTMWGGQLLAATRNNVITCDHTKQRRKRTFRRCFM